MSIMNYSRNYQFTLYEHLHTLGCSNISGQKTCYPTYPEMVGPQRGRPSRMYYVMEIIQPEAIDMLIMKVSKFLQTGLASREQAIMK